tara:strand:- start:578 stop:991 length:414 start_codon:yes stop_codon:yes gene_type:complete
MGYVSCDGFRGIATLAKERFYHASAKPSRQRAWLFWREGDEDIGSIDPDPEGRNLSVGGHPADRAVADVETGSMAGALQLVAIQAPAGQGTIVVGTAILESVDLPAYLADSDIELAYLVDPRLTLRQLIDGGDTDSR